MVQLISDAAQLQRQVPLGHGGTMAREPPHHILSQRTPGQQRRLHRDRVPYIRGIRCRIHEYRLPIVVGGFIPCHFDIQTP
jgi:hypothetical protein